jgi:ankyrin repeat protein
MTRLVRGCAAIALVFISVCIFTNALGQQSFFDLVETGTPQEVSAAIAAGADVNARDESGATVLMRAVANNPSPDTIRVLIEAGADVNMRVALLHK